MLFFSNFRHNGDFVDIHASVNFYDVSGMEVEWVLRDFKGERFPFTVLKLKDKELKMGLLNPLHLILIGFHPSQ